MGNSIDRAMVLAAGYGTRMRPLTDRLPKPLVPIAGRPMIAYALEHLRAAGVREVVVNVAHLKEPLIQYLRSYPGLQCLISEEAEPLETGGGLRHALPLLGERPLYVINSDILWIDRGEPALHRLARHWDEARMDWLFLVQSRARAVGYERGEDHLFITPENTLAWDAHEAPYIIASVYVMHPRVLAGVAPGRFSAKILWRKAMEEKRLWCVPHTGLWCQAGTIADLQRAEELIRSFGAREPSSPVTPQ
ncbi:MAG: nucleotidyltransferase family protein [Verrucomicrobiae bacterium]|nr:nucleotidyltransferase family protein [Verrucomicrobiae bacterium]